MSVQSVPASDVDFTQFVEGFNAAYADYRVPLNLEVVAMRNLIARDAIDLDGSRALVNDDGIVVGVGMLAVEGAEGWIGGLGVVPAYRARGYGRLIMNEMLQEAHARHLTQVYLEVIDGNLPAYRLYLDLGFEVVRRLFVLECRQPTIAASIRGVNEISAAAALSHYEAMHETRAPWQRRRAALQHIIHDLDGLAVYATAEEGELLGYGIGWFQAGIVRWMDLAGERHAMRQVLTYAHQQFPTARGSFINVEEEHPLLESLYSMGYTATLTQHEMRLPLRA